LFLAVAIWVAKRLWIGLRRLLRRWEQGPSIRPGINRGE
jgi:hypothetical protein